MKQSDMNIDIGLAFFTYCRPEHTRRVLESLRFNSFSHVYIFQDGLKKEKDRKSWEEVNRIILAEKNDNMDVFVSDHNKGLANSIVSGMNYVFDRHECGIALEDDMVLGKGYSAFMSKLFEKYRDEANVSCVAGCGMPVNIPDSYLYDIYFSYRMSSAAWGTWRDRWVEYKKDFGIVREIMSDKESADIFDRCGGDLKTIINGQLYGKLDSWAVFWCLLQIKNKSVCVMPVKYLAKDIGHDGKNGTNSTDFSTRYDTKLYDYDAKIEIKFPCDVFVSDEIQEQIKEIYDISDVEKIRTEQLELYKKWIRFHQHMGTLSNKLADVGRDIWIYGDGNTAALLLDEINGLANLKGVIVKDKRMDALGGVFVYSIKEMQSSDGLCIVTPTYDFTFIKKDIMHIFDENRIINLSDLL